MKAASHERDTPAGIAYGLVAYIWWGLLPLYFRALEPVPAAEILADRIVCSAVFLAIVVALGHRWRDMRQALVVPRTRRALLLSSLLIGVNWFVYIYAVNSGRTVEATLGYFINPLFSVFLGAVMFGERLRPGQQVAIGLAVMGVAALIFLSGAIPWIGVTLAISFGLYGAVRKATPVDGTIGLSVETIFLLPMAIAYLGWLGGHGTIAFGAVDRRLDLLILGTGVITPLPMIFFGHAARMLRLTTLGFMQYIAPSLQFVVALTLLHETVTWARLIGFAIVWLALAVYVTDTIRAMRRSKEPALEPVSLDA